jgi:hypothetical protein
MIGDIRHFLHAGPFEPFYIITSSGSRYRVASADHASISPQGNRVVVWFDDEGSVVVSGIHVAALEKEAPPKTKAG